MCPTRWTLSIDTPRDAAPGGCRIARGATSAARPIPELGAASTVLGTSRPTSGREHWKEFPLLFHGTPLHAIYESATALEGAEASARVLAARAHGFAGAPQAFAELASIAPEGLIPSPGRGAVHVARRLERAADLGAQAPDHLGAEVVDALEWVAGMVRRIASTSDGLDAAATARATRRGVATIRGLVTHCIPRDERFEAFRLGTYLPRAGWVAALTHAAAALTASGTPGAWPVAGAICGVGGDGSDLPTRLVADRACPGTVAHALNEAEAAILALDRCGALGSAALPLAREAQARHREAASDLAESPAAVEGADRLLDGIGALVAAIDRSHPAGPGIAPLRPPSPAGYGGPGPAFGPGVAAATAR